MFKSRKVKIMVIDACFATAALLAVTFLAPEWSEFAIKLIGIMQAPVIAVIAGIAIEDGAAKFNGNFKF